MDFGGLGIPNLQARGNALRVRWLWQWWTETDKPWQHLPFATDKSARALFNVVVRFNLGDGRKISFWHDPWLEGASLASSAPALFKQCTKRNLTVDQAIQDNKWIRHLKRELPLDAINQLLWLCDKIANINLQAGTPDTVTWKFTSDGNYSAASAYAIQFEGSQRFQFRDIIWASDTPLKCRIFSWLSILGKCHTADCLAKKGWPHNAACVLCLSEPETALHLLASCPVVIRIWDRVLATAGLPAYLAPTTNTDSLQAWISSTRQLLPVSRRKSWIALMQLTWWMTWKERNARIFQNTAAPLSRIHASIIEEADAWRNAGKSQASDLLNRPREPD